MIIKRKGADAAMVGPAEWFTGNVRIDYIFAPDAPARASAGHVTFEAGARTNWHTHPAGQILIVTAGTGRVQREGGPVESIHSGDIIYFEPNERHWHGAAPNSAMSHIAIQENINGSNAEWQEPVSNAVYQA